MTRGLIVRAPGTYGDQAGGHLLFSTLGFETRAIHAAMRYGAAYQKKVAVAFEDRKVLAFRKNEDWYRTAGTTIVRYSQDSFLDSVLHILNESATEFSELEVGIDISSMSRPMLAKIVYALCEHSKARLNVTFFYSRAVYSGELSEGSGNYSSGAITPEYVGWTADPSLPTAAVLGLGYEHAEALGAIEYLEPQSLWLFMPTGGEHNYTKEIERKNVDLLRSPPGRVDHFDIEKPFDCFLRLESLIYGLKRDARPVLVPFGPKVFTLASLLVAEIHRPSVTVWRLSREQSGDAIDRIPAGPIVRLKVDFFPDELGMSPSELSWAEA